MAPIWWFSGWEEASLSGNSLVDVSLMRGLRRLDLLPAGIVSPAPLVGVST